MGANTLPFETAPDASTWDLSTPYRPGLADVNQASLTNDGQEPPPDRSFPTAALLNTIAWLIIAANKVVPAMVISFANAAVTSVSSPSNNVTTSTISVTKNATGDYSLTWPAGTLPTSVAAPMATLNTALVATHNYAIGAVAITNGIRVTTSEDGALADLPFTVAVY